MMNDPLKDLSLRVFLHTERMQRGLWKPYPHRLPRDELCMQLDSARRVLIERVRISASHILE